MKKSPAVVESRTEEEPTDNTAVRIEVEEEPPGRVALKNRARFFGHVSDENWNDWKWHFRNRISSVDELTRHIAAGQAGGHGQSQQAMGNSFPKQGVLGVFSVAVQLVKVAGKPAERHDVGLVDGAPRAHHAVAYDEFL